MKKPANVSASAFVGFLFALVAIDGVLSGHPARAGAPNGSGWTGDTDGDGVDDVSAPIFTLLHRFMGGPAKASSW